MYVLLLFKILYFCFGNLCFKFGSEAGASAFLGIYISELDKSVRLSRIAVKKFLARLAAQTSSTNDNSLGRQAAKRVLGRDNICFILYVFDDECAEF